MADERLEDDRIIGGAARRWVIRLASEEFDAEEREEFANWLEVPQHAAAFRKSQHAWEALGELTDLREGLDADDLARMCAEPLAPIDAHAARRSRIRTAAPWAVAASILVAFIGWRVGVDEPRPLQQTAQYGTRSAQTRDVPLPDGSIVTLGARSVITTHFTTAERRVELVEGEAFFSVVRDVTRPFLVVADNTTVRVLGTRFEVHRGVDQVRVAVAEGKVEVKNGEPAGAWREDPTITVLSGGQQVIARREHIEPAREITDESAGAWRTGRLYYNETSLAEVVADINRYRAGQVRLAADDSGSLLITGSFNTNRIDQVLVDLEQILPITVIHAADGGVLITRN